MKRATGLGGVFFKVEDPERMHAWYEKHLGLAREHGVVSFQWRGADGEEGRTLWAPFPADSDYFQRPVMMNFIVEDLDALLLQLQEEGVTVDPKRDDSEYGRFAWITDVKDNRVELWEPPKKK